MSAGEGCDWRSMCMAGVRDVRPGSVISVVSLCYRVVLLCFVIM